MSDRMIEKARGADLNGQPPIFRASLASRGCLLHGALPFELPRTFDVQNISDEAACLT